MSRPNDGNGNGDDSLQPQRVFPLWQLLNGNLSGQSMVNSFFSTRSRGEWIPAADITEQSDSFTIIADLPDMKKEDIHLYTESSTAVCISGTRRHPKEQGDGRFILAERGVGRFERCFELPSKLDTMNVKASFKDAQLVVTVPKISSTQKDAGSIKIE